jgi:site-specific DNA recombinase
MKLQGYLMSPEAVTEHLRQSDSVVKEKEALLAVQTGELEKSRREIDRLYRLYQEGQLSSDEFGRFFRPAEERRKQIEEAIPKLRAEVDFCAIGAVSTEEIVAEAQSLSNFWGEMNAEERRDLVEAVTDKIVVGQGEIEIHLCYLPSGKDMSKWWRKGRDLNPR